MKLAPEPPKGDKMEKDGGSGGRCTGNDGRWWEVRAAQAMMGGGGRAWERWEGVGDSPRTPEGGQAASRGTSNW